MPHFSGDVETLFLNCKIIHGNHVLFLNPNLRKVLSVEDVRNLKNMYHLERIKTGIKNMMIPHFIQIHK